MELRRLRDERSQRAQGIAPGPDGSSAPIGIAGMLPGTAPRPNRGTEPPFASFPWRWRAPDLYAPGA
jgi:hypothetical protein